MSLKSLSDAIITRLTTAGCKNPVPLDKWSSSLPGPYTLVVSDTGYGFATGYDGKPNRGTVRWQIMCVSNSENGVKDMIDDVRSALDEFSPGGTPSSGRLSEEFSGPVIDLQSAPLDVRFSLTLNYVMTTTRGEI